MHTAIIEFPLEIAESKNAEILDETGSVESSTIESSLEIPRRLAWTLRPGLIATLLLAIAAWGALALDAMTWHFVLRFEVHPALNWLRHHGTSVLLVSAGLTFLAAVGSFVPRRRGR